MSLSVGIVGLPNVGKSTLFNALLKKQAAYAANFPFATIEPNIGVVPVPDGRLGKLAEVVKTSEKMDSLPPEVPATVEFVDIAGLIAGAHKGEGLGNKFLSHIRSVDAILHVVRLFTNEEIVRHESRGNETTKNNPIEDLEIIETELMMADFATLEKQREPKGAFSKEEAYRWSAVEKLCAAIEKGISARAVVLTEEEKKQAKELSLLSAKPILVALNVDESDLKNTKEVEDDFAQNASLNSDQVIAINAKVEEDLAGFSDSDAKDYLKDLGVAETGLKRLIQKAFTTLGLITFLTAGEKEVRAWTIRKGIVASQAAGVIHTDFEKKFIKAEIVNFEDFVNCEGWKGARENGKARQEGADYEMKDGDVVEFRIGR